MTGTNDTQDDSKKQAPPEKDSPNPGRESFVCLPSSTLRKLRKMKASEISVFLALAEFADNETGECWPSTAKLAGLCGISVRGVRLATAALAEAGLLEKSARARKDGSQSSNTYTLKGFSATIRLWSGGSFRSDAPGRAVPGGPEPTFRPNELNSGELRTPTESPSDPPSESYCTAPQGTGEQVLLVSPEQAEPYLLEFPIRNTNGTKSWGLTKKKLKEYVDTFEVGERLILRELRSARQWLCDNPAKRKTSRGMPRFLTGWLSRKNDKGWSSSPSSPPRAPEPAAPYHRKMN